MSTSPEEPDDNPSRDVVPPTDEPARDGVLEPGAPAESSAADAGNTAAEQAPDSSDRRVHPRRRKLLRVHVIDVVKNSEAFSGWVVDRSVGGMCLSVDHEIEPGTHLKVRPTTVPASAPWVELRVQTIRPQDGTFDLGCEFLRTPTWEVLVQFG